VILGDTAKRNSNKFEKIPSKLTSYTYLNTTINSPTPTYFPDLSSIYIMQFLVIRVMSFIKAIPDYIINSQQSLQPRLDRREGPGPRPRNCQESTID